MAERGRPPFQITDEIIQKAESYGARGLNLQQIADALGISYQTLNEKSKEFADFSEAIKRGKAKGIARYADNLLKNADNGNVSAQIFYLKVHAGWKETDVLEHQGKDGGAIKVESELKLNAQSLLAEAMNAINKDKEKLNDEVSGKPNV